MGAFFRILLTAVLFFYLFSIIVKLIFKWRIKRLERQMRAYSQEDPSPSNDEAKNPHIDPNIGEYTDFEEVE